MKFLVDNQLPPALARFLSDDLGVHAVHVQDLKLAKASDKELWAYASEQGFIVISKDGDFAALYSRTQTAKLLWVRIQNCRRVELLSVFRRQWPKIIEHFGAGEGFVELR